MPFEIVRNDITRMRVDAIVNAANRSLLGGGGVDGAIHRAAGPGLLEECRGLHGCETGETKLTGGYNLPAKYVIHTVGPVWHGGDRGEQALLTACYRNSLAVAEAHGCETVAFPLISSGIYGYPKDQAMAVAVETITRFLQDHDMTVYLVLFGRGDFRAGGKLFRDIRAYMDDVRAETRAPRQKTQPGRVQAREDAAPRAARPLEAYEDAAAPFAAGPDWNALLKQTDEGFSQALLRLIDARGMSDAECYRRANVDRKLFSKIRSNPDYRPSKPTACAFAVALGLDLRETRDLLARAGFALSHASKFDIIVEYCILHGIYDVHEINGVLFDFDMPLLGSGVSGNP